MSYIEKNVLSNGEQIVYVPKKNPVFVVLAWIWGILGCWLILIPTIKAIKKTIVYCSTEFAVTNKKVVEKYGLFSTHCDELALDKIENITVNRTFWGKIFNFGDVRIQGTNRNDVNYRFVKNPEQVRKEINNIKG